MKILGRQSDFLKPLGACKATKEDLPKKQMRKMFSLFKTGIS